MSIPDLLHQLLIAPAPSGSEERATAVWRDAAAPFAEVSGDTLGSSFARVVGSRRRSRSARSSATSTRSA